MAKQALHKPVLLKEAIDAMNIQSDNYYIDTTFGRGGHTSEILTRGGKVIAFDCDHQAIEYAKQQFADEIGNGQLIIVRANFENLKKEFEKLKQNHQLKEIKAILFDFGTSVDQLKSSTRGFSFEKEDSILDMRMDDRLGVQAKDLLALLSEKQLTHVFREYGGEDFAKPIAREIVELRKSGHPLTTVGQLKQLILKVKKHRRGHLDPATKIFQALRIVVNNELESIQQSLPQALETLANGGKLVTISFHEGEDRIIKNYFRNWQINGLGTNLTKKPIRPGIEENQINPRSRSAKLRIFEKT
jgi:16S rRNA (cytosine1402-N4)-methyltransferase